MTPKQPGMKYLKFCLVLILVSCQQNDNEPEYEVPNPIINSFTPEIGYEGTTVVINGVNFDIDASKISVSIGGFEIQPKSSTINKIEFNIPSDVETGRYPIHLIINDKKTISKNQIEIIDKAMIDDEEVQNFNYSIGTQSIGPSYGFTNENRLVETAQAIHEMGSNILKISLKPSKYGVYSSSDDTPPAQLLSQDPSFSKVLDMPFNYYFFWAKSHAKWSNGYTKEERMQDSIQIADLTKHLLIKYNNTGKQFFLGHWEGDWYLLKKKDLDYIPPQSRIDGMIQWYTCRQNAVDEAIRTTPHSNVNVYTYCEVNRVVDAMNGKPRVVNKVLPYTNVDYVSYSSYDAQRMSNSEYSEVLDYIESYLPERSHITGKRVFIGEMGVKAKSVGFSQTEHKEINLEYIRKSISWGTPFILYWEMYNNEVDNGVQQGYWLIDDKNDKWPLYYAYKNFYHKAKIWVATQKKQLNRVPTQEEYLQWALNNF